MSYQFGHVERDERIDHVEEPEYEEWPPRRRMSGVVVAAALTAVFAGGLGLAYHLGTKHAATADEPANIPLIRAVGDPVKVKPDKAGGLDVPDQDNPLYTRKPGGAAVEHILPQPEQPQPRPAAPPPPPPTRAEAPAPAEPAAPPARNQAAALPRNAPQPVAPAASGTGPRVQLASVRSPEAARDEWARLKHDNPDLLGRLTANAVRADLGEKGIYYRIEAGPLTDKAAADRLCKALKDRGLGCGLVK
jgi:hypothetical protein